MNYSYLVKGTPVTPGAKSEYMILVVYEDLEGNTSVTGTKGLLDVNADEDADGGWSYNQGAVSPDSNADVKNAFDRAMEKLDGADYDPIAYIGSQTVAGTNYAVLCSVTPVTPDAGRTFCLVTISEAPDGNAEMTDAETPYTTISIAVIDKTMIEVSYCTQDKAEVGYSIRKAACSDDIGGDYNDYAETKTEKAGGVAVTLKGNDGTWSVATWTSGGYSYSINAAEHPFTEGGILDIVKHVR